MKIRYAEIPDEIIRDYELEKIIHSDGYVYLKIHKLIPGLKQAGNISNYRLNKNLAQNGYQPCKHTTSLWKHETRKIIFALVVDDFGIKYIVKENFDNLLNYLKEDYNITIDPSGKKFLDLEIKWDYEEVWVEISMPGYVELEIFHFK